MNDVNFEVQDDEIKGKLRQIAEWLSKMMPTGWGFNFMMFNFGEKGNVFYISNASRDDMIMAMLTFLQKQKEAIKVDGIKINKEDFKTLLTGAVLDKGVAKIVLEDIGFDELKNMLDNAILDSLMKGLK